MRKGKDQRGKKKKKEEAKAKEMNERGNHKESETTVSF